MKISNFEPNCEIERMLLVMPKNCKCAICEASKEKAKNKLGRKKYNRITKQLGIV